jgi:hypothetical protein
MNKDQVLGIIAQLMEANALSFEDLNDHQSTPTGSSDGQSLAEYVAKVLDGLTKNTGGSYKTHFNHLLNGVARQCECICATCVADFARTRTCSCQCTKCAKATNFPALGEKQISKRFIMEINIDQLAALVQTMATKRAMHANLIRAHKGLTAKPTHGQGAREMCVSSMRCLFKKMVKQQIITINPAEDTSKGHRSEPNRRALTDAELTQLLETVVTGGDDPVLDLALTWAELELGARRGGILNLTVGRLDRVAQVVGLLEKGNKIGRQPCSLPLIDFMFAIAKERGGDRCVPGHSMFDPNAAVFYFKDSTPTTLHAVSGRRFDTLHKRIQRTLPLANTTRETLGTEHQCRHSPDILDHRRVGKL